MPKSEKQRERERDVKEMKRDPVKSIWKMGGLTPRELSHRVYNEIWHDELLDRAAALGFYFLLALFPLIIFLFSLIGVLVNPGSDLQARIFHSIARVAPPEATDLVARTLSEVLRSGGGAKITFGIVLTLWFASGGMTALMAALNAAYDVRETRSWLKTHWMAMALTVCMSVLVISALMLVLFGGNIAGFVEQQTRLGGVFVGTWKVLQWPAALALMVLAFAVIYYFAPDVEDQKWYWITPGSIVCVLLWMAVSLGFRAYLSFYNQYSATYGSLGAVIILMMWLYLTGIAILLGAEINAEIEHAAAARGVKEAKPTGEKESAA
jgi:membrane protein